MAKGLVAVAPLADEAVRCDTFTNGLALEDPTLEHAQRA